MILVDHQIRERLNDGLVIGDFDEAFLQPASYDLRIGKNLDAPPQFGLGELARPRGFEPLAF